MKRYLLLLISGGMLNLQAFSGIKTAISNNSNGWSVASNWFPLGVPENGDTVIIPATFSLSVKGNIYNNDKPRLIVYVYGTMDFDPAGKIDLDDASEIYVFTGGSISTNGSSSERIIINGVTKFNGQTDGNISGPLFANSTTGSAPSGFSPFTILPVKLIQFSHELKSSNLQLYWTLVHETGIHQYVLERRRNNLFWETIQIYNSPAAAGEMHLKNYNDKLLSNDLYEYRLHFKDVNGQSQYSKTIRIQADQLTSEIKIFPNPATSRLEFNTGKVIDNCYISLSNGTGKIVYRSALLTGQKTSIDISHLPKGIYTLFYSGNNEKHAEIIMIR